MVLLREDQIVVLLFLLLFLFLIVFCCDYARMLIDMLSLELLLPDHLVVIVHLTLGRRDRLLLLVDRVIQVERDNLGRLDHGGLTTCW